MEIKESNNPSGYGKPPWIFKGSALYQFHLVKAETARAFIPKEFKLVEAFGYTLGGFFLANYENSPAGTFDELVVIAGIVWNPPTSCAWAARVLVDSKDACNHGRKEVGLPSQVAKFSKKNRVILKKTERNGNISFLESIFSKQKEDSMDLHVSEIQGLNTTSICNINLGIAAPEPSSNKWMMGPSIKMSLPSFSGLTEYNPHLLKYSCQIQCRVRPISPAKVSTANDDDDDHSFANGEYERNLSVSVMLSRPIFALQFNCLKMEVEAPTIISQHKHHTLTQATTAK